jgi:hypothetical protein
MDKPVHLTPEEVRLRLLAAGFAPIPVYGKTPAPEEWQRRFETNPDEIALWSRMWPDAVNTGILTRLAPAFDIDIRNPEAAEAVERLVRERYEDILVRFGQRPKRAVLFRCERPFRKILRLFEPPAGDPEAKADGLEFLADGQQLVVHGLHPETHQPYTWFGGEPGEVRYQDLPAITEASARRVVDEATALLIDKYGYKLNPKVTDLRGGRRQGAGRKREWNGPRRALATVKLDTACEALRNAAPGTRDAAIGSHVLEIGSIAAGGGLDPHAALAALLEAGAALGRDNLKKIERAFATGMKSPAMPPTIEHGETIGDMIVDAKGRPLTILPNILTRMRTAPELKDLLRYNEFTLKIIVTRPILYHTHAPNETYPKFLEDNDETQINEYLQRTGLLNIASWTLHDAIVACAKENAFHPIRDYLNGLRWDGEPRLYIWIEKAFGDLSDPKYTTAIGQMFLISMVARIFVPGCKVDHTLVLEGPQGKLKSTALEVLASQEWFSDDLPDLHDKDAKLHVRGKWIIELAEMHRLHRATTTAIKSFLTRRYDLYRPPYGRAEISQPRQCVFSATTNLDQYLTDETGNRRAWPIKCEKVDLEWLRTNRDQLFAEAVTLYRAGTPWWPDGELAAATIEPQQQARLEIGAFDERVMGVIAGLAPPLSLEDIASALDPHSIGDWSWLQRHLAPALKRIGWEPILIRPAVGAKPRRLWRPKLG